MGDECKTTCQCCKWSNLADRRVVNRAADIVHLIDEKAAKTRQTVRHMLTRGTGCFPCHTA